MAASNAPARLMWQADSWSDTDTTAGDTGSATSASSGAEPHVVTVPTAPPLGTPAKTLPDRDVDDGGSASAVAGSAYGPAPDLRYIVEPDDVDSCGGSDGAPAQLVPTPVDADVGGRASPLHVVAPGVPYTQRRDDAGERFRREAQARSMREQGSPHRRAYMSSSAQRSAASTAEREAWRRADALRALRVARTAELRGVGSGGWDGHPTRREEEAHARGRKEAIDVAVAPSSWMTVSPTSRRAVRQQRRPRSAYGGLRPSTASRVHVHGAASSRHERSTLSSTSQSRRELHGLGAWLQDRAITVSDAERMADDAEDAGVTMLPLDEATREYAVQRVPLWQRVPVRGGGGSGSGSAGERAADDDRGSSSGSGSAMYANDDDDNLNHSMADLSTLDRSREVLRQTAEALRIAASPRFTVRRAADRGEVNTHPQWTIDSPDADGASAVGSAAGSSAASELGNQSMGTSGRPRRRRAASSASAAASASVARPSSPEDASANVYERRVARERAAAKAAADDRARAAAALEPSSRQRWASADAGTRHMLQQVMTTSKRDVRLLNKHVDAYEAAVKADMPPSRVRRVQQRERDRARSEGRGRRTGRRRKQTESRSGTDAAAVVRGVSTGAVGRTAGTSSFLTTTRDQEKRRLGLMPRDSTGDLVNPRHTLVHKRSVAMPISTLPRRSFADTGRGRAAPEATYTPPSSFAHAKRATAFVAEHYGDDDDSADVRGGGIAFGSSAPRTTGPQERRTGPDTLGVQAQPARVRGLVPAHLQTGRQPRFSAALGSAAHEPGVNGLVAYDTAHALKQHVWTDIVDVTPAWSRQTTRAGQRPKFTAAKEARTMDVFARRRGSSASYVAPGEQPALVWEDTVL